MTFTKDQAQQIINVLLKCWHYECDEECPWYDWSPDEGFHCERYKSFNQVEELFKELIERVDRGE